MPIIQVNIRLSEDERRLLRKQATKQGMSEADYFRVCMIVDGVMSGDPLAFKITGKNLREKVGRRVGAWLEDYDARVKV